MVPIIINNIPPENVLKLPDPKPSGLMRFRPERIKIQMLKRINVNANISKASKRILVAKAATDTANTIIKIPKVRTATGFFGIEIHQSFVCG